VSDKPKDDLSAAKLDPDGISGIAAAAAQGALEGEKQAKPEPDAMVDPRSPQVTGGVNVGTDDVAAEEDDRE
jgi:hypothetical protein